MAGVALSVANQELNQIKQFQLSQYEETGPEDTVEHPYVQAFVKIILHTGKIEQMNKQITDGKLVATANREFHAIRYEYMVAQLPALVVKENDKIELEIAWTHSIGHNLCTVSQLMIDQDLAQTLTPLAMDVHSQRFLPPGFRNQYNYMIGNVPILENWSKELPSYPICVIFPWYHSYDLDKALQLTLTRLQTVTYSHQLRTKIAELLRIRIRRKGTEEPWKELDQTAVGDIISRGLIHGAGNGDMKIPEVWGRYVLYGKDGKSYMHCNPYTIQHTRDFVICSDQNPKSLGTSVPVNVSCRLPVRSLHIVAENTLSTSRNNYSNYTTNAGNVYEGHNPIKQLSYNYGESAVYKEMASIHFDSVETFTHSTSEPSEAGFNMIAYSIFSHRIDGDIAFVLTEANPRITVLLGDTNPYHSIKALKDRPGNNLDQVDDIDEILLSRRKTEDKETKKEDNYLVQVCAYVSRQIHFIKSKEKKQNEESIYIVHVDPRDETGNLLERDPLGIDIKS